MFINQKNLKTSNIEIKKGTPALKRPSKEEISNFPLQAKNIVDNINNIQNNLIKENKYNNHKLSGKHFIIAGGSGFGLGGALVCSIMKTIKDAGSLIMISRDLSRSLGFETGKYMQRLAKSYGIEERFAWVNDGMCLEGVNLDNLIKKLIEFKADKLIYINTVAAASSGLINSKQKPIYIKDVEKDNLFAWELETLSEKAIENTRFFMGEMAVSFPEVLKSKGFEIEIGVFSDWRGSLDKLSRDQNHFEYGRQGAYSSSLYLPKEIIQEKIIADYGNNTNYIDIFYPIMQTRALSLIPGGKLMELLSKNLMEKLNIKYISVPELALKTLECIYENLFENNKNPFPRLDSHEIEIDLWYYEIIKKLNNIKSDKFYYKNWIK